MTNITNIVVSPHNTWTLVQHVSASINKAAGKMDAAIYGTTTNMVVRPAPPAPPMKQGMSLPEVLMAIGAMFAIMVIFIALITGNIKGRDLIGF